MSLSEFGRLLDAAVGCRVEHIREVSWHHHEDSRYNYIEVQYFSVARNGASLYWVDSEELPGSAVPPDYTYKCTACDTHMYHWSEVIVHVFDAA